MYIYQSQNWPNFSWNEQEIQLILGKVRYLQGRLLERMNRVGFSSKEEVELSAITQNVIKSSEIEGEIFNYEQVRSSIARKLGIKVSGMVLSNRNIDGVVDMLLDATKHYDKALDEERLFAWHASMFPDGRSGMYKIDTGCYRKGEMRIVSGPIGKEKIHYIAPSAEIIKQEMDKFLLWFNSDSKIDLVLKAAIAHFWFIIIHPFDDGNGRIARAISDLLLARSDDNPQRFYSLSNQILIERKKYYEVLQRVQFSEGDITEWIIWFLNCVYNGMQSTEILVQNVFHKANFWDKHTGTELNSRQRLMLNKLLDGFEGKLTTSKWAKISKCSSDTALRDINDLINKDILLKELAGGRSTNYQLKI